MDENWRVRSILELRCSGGDPVFLSVLAGWLTSMYGRETSKRI